jgi:DNA invertase Pin-like site-specific DNA recombinase
LPVGNQSAARKGKPGVSAVRLIGYVRVSTEEMAKEGVSLDAQRAKVQQYATLHGLDLVDVLVDAGVSAKSLDRPGLTRALARLEAGEADGIVVAKLDRLSRSVRDWNDLIDRYFGDRAGRTLMSVADSIDTRTAAGRLVLNVLMSVAQWERETIVERTREALGHKRQRGERVGKVPLGWDLASDGKTLVPNPRDQEARALVKRLRRAGWTFKAIGAELLRRGIMPRSGRPSWAPSTLHFLARAES